MAGLPKKYAKMGFAKGWRAYKASKRKASGGTRKQAKRARLPLLPKPKKKGATTMAKRRRRTTVKRVTRRVTRRARTAMRTRPAQMLTGAAIATAGGVGSSMLINNAPVLKDLDKGFKSIGQIGAGMAVVMMLRNPMLRAAGAGAIVAGTMAAAKHYLKVEPLAGGEERSTLTPYQLNAMVEEMQGRRLGRPSDYSMGLGRPVDYAGHGSLSGGGWKRDKWG